MPVFPRLENTRGMQGAGIFSSKHGNRLRNTEGTLSNIQMVEFNGWGGSALTQLHRTMYFFLERNKNWREFLITNTSYPKVPNVSST